MNVQGKDFTDDCVRYCRREMGAAFTEHDETLVRALLERLLPQLNAKFSPEPPPEPSEE